jgi:hypothetical protein
VRMKNGGENFRWLTPRRCRNCRVVFSGNVFESSTLESESSPQVSSPIVRVQQNMYSSATRVRVSSHRSLVFYRSNYGHQCDSEAVTSLVSIIIIADVTTRFEMECNKILNSLNASFVLSVKIFDLNTCRAARIRFSLRFEYFSRQFKSHLQD